MEHVVRRLFRAIGNARDISQVHRTAGGYPDDHGTDVRGVPEEGAGLEQDLCAREGPRPSLDLAVGLPQGAGHIGGRETARRKGGTVKLDAHGTAVAAEEHGLGDLRHRLDHVVDLRRQPAQREVIEASTVERDGQDRHVVDRARFDERRGHPGRDAVGVAGELLVQPHQGGLNICPHLETHDREGGARARGRIEVLHVRDLPEQLLHRPREPVLDLLWGRAGQRREHVDDRDLDLGLLLAREPRDREDPEQDGRQDGDRGQL